MLWKISNFLSAIIASFVSKDKITAILLKRSLFIAINKILSFLSVICVAMVAFFAVYFAFNFNIYKDKISNKMSEISLNMQNYGFLKSHLTKQVDITVNDTVVVNRVEINQILAKYKAKSSIVFIDLDEIAKQILALPFVKDVYIKRSFFSTIKIVIFEKDISFIIKIQPSSVNTFNFMTLDSDGNMSDLKDVKSIPAALLGKPHISSSCNNEEFIKSVNDLYKILLNYNELYQRIKEATFYNCKNWHIYLKNGDMLLLGEDNISRGIYKYMVNHNKIDILQSSPHRIDLRFDGKIYIKSLNEASQQ